MLIGSDARCLGCFVWSPLSHSTQPGLKLGQEAQHLFFVPHLSHKMTAELIPFADEDHGTLLKALKKCTLSDKE